MHEAPHRQPRTFNAVAPRHIRFQVFHATLSCALDQCHWWIWKTVKTDKNGIVTKLTSPKCHPKQINSPENKLALPTLDKRTTSVCRMFKCFARQKNKKKKKGKKRRMKCFHGKLANNQRENLHRVAFSQRAPHENIPCSSYTAQPLLGSVSRCSILQGDDASASRTFRERQQSLVGF